MNNIQIGHSEAFTISDQSEPVGLTSRTRLFLRRWWSRGEETQNADQQAMLLQDWDGEREEIGRPPCQPSNFEQIAVRYLLATWTAIRPVWVGRRQKCRLSPTSWLDGVRGFAALFVCIAHFSGSVRGLHQENEGAGPNDHSLLRTPILRLMINGTPHVDLFFVISGFALSYRPLRFAREQDLPSLVKALSSATLRRACRLFLPASTMMFLISILGYFGLALYPYQPINNSMSEQLRLWLWDTLRIINPFDVHVTYTESLRFAPYLWSIPVEFRASLHVFVVLLALSGAGNTARFIAIVIVELWLFIIGQSWDIFLFNTGILICEIHWRRTNKQQSKVDQQTMVLPQDEPRRLSTDQLQTQSLHQNQTDITPLWLEQSNHHPKTISEPTAQSNREKPRKTCPLNLNLFRRHRFSRNLFRRNLFRRHVFRRQSCLIIAKAVTFLLILYIMSMPDDEESPSFEESPYPLYSWIHRNVGGAIMKPFPISETLSNGTSIVKMVPPEPFLPQWHGHTNPGRLHTVLSAAAFILFVDWTSPIQKIFTLGFPQYLGDISYSLYLVHPQVWKFAGAHMWGYVMDQTSLPTFFSGLPLESGGGADGTTTPTTVRTDGPPPSTLQGREICFVLMLAILLPIAFYAADLVMRFIDKPSINLARWIETRFFSNVVIRYP